VQRRRRVPRVRPPVPSQKEFCFVASFWSWSLGGCVVVFFLEFGRLASRVELWVKMGTILYILKSSNKIFPVVVLLRSPQQF